MRKLSLCVIAGNAEKYIERFLDAFQHVADEICVVRAIGNQDPDRTLDICEARGCKVAEYFNAEGNCWPHVDDFAAARNLAFSMGSGDWLMWADTDDIIDHESCDTIRGTLRGIDPGIDVLLLPYDIPDDGVSHLRERCMRRGCGEWRSPIHESFHTFNEDARTGKITSARIVHAPLGKRTVNNERNLRILEAIPEDERTSSHRFHLFQSMRAVGLVDESREYLADLIVNHKQDFDTPELFELYIALGQLTPDPAMRAQLMLQAVATDPSRREGYGEMVLCSLGMRQPKNALAWAEAMNGLRPPLQADWNLRRKYYGWSGVALHAMALRACGRMEEADAIQTNHTVRHGAKISLIHATRGRPKQAIEARQRWLEMAADPDAIEHIFCMDVDDEAAGPMSLYRHVITESGGPVLAWNAGAALSVGEVLVQMSDDWNPPLHWDRLILDAIGDTSKPAVLAVSDGHRTDDMLCMGIVTRARYKQQGYFFHPEFFSMYSDFWFSECAFRDGVVIDARDSIHFEHLHPLFGKADNDETYQHTNAQIHYKRGERTLQRLQKGVLTSGDVGGWCDFRPFYEMVAHSLQPGQTFVEIGSWLGKSIILLAQELQNIGREGVNLVVVDTFKGEQNQPMHLAEVARNGGSNRAKFEQNIRAAGVDHMIRIIESDSAEAASLFDDGSLDGVFIDAAHDYESVRKDVEAWFPKVKETGIFSGHDYPWHEVRRAVDEHAAANGYQVAGLGRVWFKTKQ